MAWLFYRFLSDPVDREVLLTTLTTANYGYLLLALGLFVLAVVTNAIKWYILLRAQGIPVPLGALTNYTFVGFFFNNFLPANVGGDVMRGFGLARYTARSAEAAVSVIVDRIIGLMAFMFTVLAAALVAVSIAPAGQSGGSALADNLTQVEIVAVVGLAVITGVFGVILSQRLRLRLSRVFEFKLLRPLAPLYRRLSEAFGAYRHQFRALLAAFAVGVVTVMLTGRPDCANLHISLEPHHCRGFDCADQHWRVRDRLAVVCLFLRVGRGAGDAGLCPVAGKASGGLRGQSAGRCVVAAGQGAKEWGSGDQKGYG
jgi:hypothetical protein